MTRLLRRRLALSGLLALSLFGLTGPVQADPPGPGASPILAAHLAWHVDPIAHCPDLRMADDGVLAVVIFYVDTSGHASQPSIRVSSQSEPLDAAAVACVTKLRFQPATRPGDAEPVGSWQRMAWRWAAPANPTPAAPAPAVGAAVAAVPVAVLPQAQDGAATIRVCTDQSGQLSQAPTVLRSSGDPALDAAAVKIAAGGSGSYRPAATVNGKALSGCAQVTIRFETR